MMHNLLLNPIMESEKKNDFLSFNFQMPCLKKLNLPEQKIYPI